jgi:putative glutamine amidotransferase
MKKKNLRYSTLSLIFLAFTVIGSACSDTKDNKKETFRILVSKDPKASFAKWLKTYNTETDSLVFTNMYAAFSKDSFNYWLPKADGIIISGGEDINPALYGRPEATERCGTIDKKRDSLELLMINHAYENQIPMLAVCRGHQLLNVAFGGTLIVDIPEDYGSKTMHRDEGSTKHRITIKSNSRLYAYTEPHDSAAYHVYSNHHQAVSRTAEGFSVTSYAPDGIAESIELTDFTKHPFILGVQWHPEAMDYEHSLSKKIGIKFLEVIRNEKSEHLKKIK